MREENGANNDGTHGQHYVLGDFRAALLQSFIAKRILTIDDALRIFEEIADATGHFLTPDLH
jgi:hypothetical protein